MGKGLAMRASATLIMAVSIVLGTAGLSKAATLNTMDDVGAAIRACWTPPSGVKNSTVTLSFSFKRDGTLIGPPRPTAIHVQGDAKARKSFVDAATSALAQCLPLTFSPTLAKGIGGTVFTLQFASK